MNAELGGFGFLRLLDREVGLGIAGESVGASFNRSGTREIRLSPCDSEENVAAAATRGHELVKTSFAPLSAPSVERVGSEWIYTQDVQLDPGIVHDCDFFVRFGLDGAEWWSQEVRPHEVSPLGDNQFRVSAALHIEKTGSYGATLAVRHSKSRELCWQGRPKIDDARFVVSELYSRRDAQTSVFLVSPSSLVESVYSYVSFSRELQRYATTGSHVSRELFRLASANPALRERLSEYVAHAREILRSSRSTKERKIAGLVLGVLERIGIGEVVLISPEGPHASAGGLAQVIGGLLRSLSESDIQTTLIAPLYEEENGKRHSSAESLLQKGVLFDGRYLPLRPCGEIFVRYHETQDVVFGGTRSLSEMRPVEVYLAEGKNVRFYFLRHRRLADKLYRNVWADEQIRRSVFLCQGALEVMRDARFGMAPHLVMTNDWVTGLVPALMQTHPRYREDVRLKDVATVHVIHNGGKDYQGRFATQFFGEDLFPLLGIGAEHYFGLTDPHDRRLLNFTAAALYHVREAILTVSRPYASELLTVEGGEGLESLYRRRRRILFGISNGIDGYGIRKSTWEQGFLLRGDEARAGRFRDALYVRRLPMLKREIKREVQTRFGLRQDSEALLVCLVGRIAEQKGIRLLTDVVDQEESLLSLLLRDFPDVQFLLSGPKSDGDLVAETLSNHVEVLQSLYPGRISTSFEYLPHKDAVQIAAGSDLFLMPSRYEPGGISQLEALAVGTPVVARNVGGLQATLTNYTGLGSAGTGFLFDGFSSTDLAEAVGRGLLALRDARSRMELIQNTASAQNDWSDRFPRYLALFRFIAGVSSASQTLDYLPNEREIVESMRASGV